MGECAAIVFMIFFAWAGYTYCKAKDDERGGK
jgi:TRAP-type C4-dicarboxylate transport system permease small subunit